MEFNVKKCKLMYVGRSNGNFEYIVNESKLQIVDSKKDLGIIITDDRKSSGQYLNAYNKAIRTRGMINKTITYMAVFMTK